MSSKEAALRPCPFCGGAAVMSYMWQKTAHRGRFQTVSIRCGWTSCNVNPHTIQFELEDEGKAREFWNRRHKEQGDAEGGE